MNWMGVLGHVLTAVGAGVTGAAGAFWYNAARANAKARLEERFKKGSN